MTSQLEIRRNYDRECVKLKIWYVHRLLQTEQRRFEELITTRVDIYRRTHLWDGKRHPAQGHPDPEWNDLVDRLQELFQNHRADETTQALEEAAYALLLPAMEQRLAGERKGNLWEGAGQVIPPTPYGSFSRDYAEDRVYIHFTNMVQPKSPFWDMPTLTRYLLKLLDDLEHDRPDIQIVQCGSWINNFPPFAALFPPEWHENSRVSGPAFTYGWWGQFMTHTGDFHYGNAKRFRATGEFPYTCISCSADRDSVRGHVEKLLEEYGDQGALHPIS